MVYNCVYCHEFSPILSVFNRVCQRLHTYITRVEKFLNHIWFTWCVYKTNVTKPTYVPLTYENVREQCAWKNFVVYNIATERRQFKQLNRLKCLQINNLKKCCGSDV